MHLISLYKNQNSIRFQRLKDKPNRIMIPTREVLEDHPLPPPFFACQKVTIGLVTSCFALWFLFYIFLTSFGFFGNFVESWVSGFLYIFVPFYNNLPNFSISFWSFSVFSLPTLVVLLLVFFVRMKFAWPSTLESHLFFSFLDLFFE